MNRKDIIGKDKNKDTLPPVGSFSLIKDLVNEFTELTVVQEKERKKQEIDSLRAYPGTNIANHMSRTYQKNEKTSIGVVDWGGNEPIQNRATLLMSKGIRDNGGTGRF